MRVLVILFFLIVFPNVLFSINESELKNFLSSNIDKKREAPWVSPGMHLHRVFNQKASKHFKRYLGGVSAREKIFFERVKLNLNLKELKPKISACLSSLKEEILSEYTLKKTSVSNHGRVSDAVLEIWPHFLATKPWCPSGWIPYEGFSFTPNLKYLPITSLYLRVYEETAQKLGYQMILCEVFDQLDGTKEELEKSQDIFVKNGLEIEELKVKSLLLDDKIKVLTAEAAEKERLRAAEEAAKTQAIQEKQELEKRLAALVDPRGYREKMMALSQENLKFRRQRDGSWQVIQELRTQLDQEKSDLETQISVLTAQVKTLQDQLRGQTQELFATLGVPAEGQDSEEENGTSLQSALKTLMEQKQTWALKNAELAQKVSSLEEKEKAQQSVHARLQQEVERLGKELEDQQADFSGQRDVWAEEKDQLEARVRSQNRLLDEKFESALAS